MQNSRIAFLALSTLGIGALLSFSTKDKATAQVQGSLPSYVKLQTSTPGASQTGNTHISGTGIFDSGVGIGVTPTTALLDFPASLGDKVCLYPISSLANYGLGITLNTLQIHTAAVTDDIAFGYGRSASMVETVRIKGNGNVGIGTGFPSTKLDVNGIVKSQGMIASTALGAQGFSVVSSATGVTKAEMQYTSELGSGGGSIHLYGGVGNRRFFAEGLDTDSRGIIGLDNSAGTTKVQAYISFTGNGIITADNKNFKIPNPNNEKQDIFYCCIEGPEAAMYDRGTLKLDNGRCHVELPDHFSSLASPNGITLTLTPGSGSSRGLAFENRTPYGFDVVELGDGKGNYSFDWEIKAVRRGQEDYRVIRPWDEELPAKKSRAEAWEARKKDIAFYKGRFDNAPALAQPR